MEENQRFTKMGHILRPGWALLATLAFWLSISHIRTSHAFRLPITPPALARRNESQLNLAQGAEDYTKFVDLLIGTEGPTPGVSPD